MGVAMSNEAPHCCPPMYCKRCDYPLHSLSQTLCPECGWPFDPDNPRTYQRRPWHRLARRCCRVVAILLAAVLLSALALAASLWGWFYLGWRAEQPTIAAIRATQGGQVHCHPGRSGDWLQDLFGGPGSPLGFAFERARDAILQADPACATLRPLGKLRDLRLNGPRVSDRSLQLAATAPNLISLYVINASITNSGLGYLRGMSRPYALALAGIPLDDSAVPYLAQLSAMRTMHMAGTRMPPDGIRQLQCMLPGARIVPDRDGVGVKDENGAATQGASASQTRK